MTIDIGDVLREGFDRTVARNGLLLAAVFVGFGIVNAIVQQSLNRVQFDRFFDSGELAPLFDDLPITLQEFNDIVREATPLAYLESQSLGVLVGLALVFAVVAEAIRIVAVRTFVSERTGTVPTEFLSRNIAWAVVNGIVGGIVVGILVVVGLVFLVVPGIVLAVALIFVRQEIAVEDENFVAAIANSWSLTSGHRIELFGLAAILFLLGFGASLLVGGVTPGDSAVGAILNAIVDALVLTYSVAGISRAYDQLKTGTPTAAGGATDDEDDELADIDDELLP